MVRRENRFPLYLIGVSLLGALIAWLLGGCTPTPVRLTCPPLVQYSRDEQVALAEELRAHPDLREVPVFLTDYGNERAECRALDTKP